MTTVSEFFGIPTEPNPIQDAKHRVGIAKRLEANRLKQLADMNLQYAEAIEETIARTGQGSIRMTALHRTCAERHLLQAEQIYPSDDTAIYDSIGQRF